MSKNLLEQFESACVHNYGVALQENERIMETLDRLAEEKALLLIWLWAAVQCVTDNARSDV